MKIKKKPDIFPLDLSGNYYIEIINNREIVLTGFFEINELEKTVLKIICGEHNIIFYGNDIKISAYTSDGFKINGNINRIEFE